MKKYPFDTFADMWPYVSQLDVSFDIDRLHSRLLLAKKDIENVIGAETYKLVNDYFWEEPTEHESPTTAQLDELLSHLQGAMANFTIYRQYIWMVMKVSADGVTQRSGDEYKPVSQSMSQEAKKDLIDSATMFMDDLITFLDANIADFPTWGAVRETKPALKLFSNVNEFNRYTNYKSTPYFFELLYQIIDEIERDKVASRFQTLAELDDTIKYNLRKAVAYDAMSEAVFQFDYQNLPEPIRQDIDKPNATKDSSFVKDRLRKHYAEKAATFYESATELNVEKQNTGLETDPVPYETIINSSDEDKCVFV